MKRKYINNGNIKNNKAKGLNGQYKVVDKGKTKDSVLALKFLGKFKKKPIVKMARIDITPFLNGNNYSVLPSQDSASTYNVHSQSYHNLISTLKLDCKVNITKDNLSHLLDIINENRLNVSIQARLKLINDEYTKFYGDNNNYSHSTPIKLDTKKQRKSVSFSDKVVVHEIQEYHKCSKCSKIFVEYSKLRSHIRAEHKKKKQYECNYCKKSFVDRAIFKVHIKLHCDMCGLFCKKRADFLIHRRDVCRIVKRYTCKDCENVFFKFMDLKDHTYDHKEGTYYICDICKEQCTNPCYLAHHIKFLHLKKRPQSLYEVRNLNCDRLYLCNFCEFTSVDKDLIESHVEILPDFSNRVMTGYKDYYFCDQCFKNFDTETDMLQHKWTHFLITNTENTSNLKSPKEDVNHHKEKSKKHKKKRPLIKIKSLKFVSSNNQEVKSQKRLKLKLKCLKKRERKLKEFHAKTNKVSNTKLSYNIHENVPMQFKPIIILDRTVVPKYLEEKQRNDNKIIHFVDIDALNDTLTLETRYKDIDIDLGDGKPLINKTSKKTLLSNHQCDICFRYLSSRHTLRRHFLEVHEKTYECKKCNNIYTSKKDKLLHDCIYADVIAPNHSNIDDLNISDDFMENVDFEIPAPIVELTESEGFIVTNDVDNDFGTANGFMNTGKNNDTILRRIISEPLKNNFDNNYMDKVSFQTPVFGTINFNNGFPIVNPINTSNCSNNLTNSPLNVSNHSVSKLLSSTVKSNVNNVNDFNYNATNMMQVEFL